MRNGAISDKKVKCTRSSAGFTVKAPTKNVESFTAHWVTDESQIKLTVSNAFYVNTPIEFALKLDKPLQKNQEIAIPLKINGTIFNKASSYDFKDNISQNNGSNYTSKDGSFKYWYDKEKGQLTIKALDDRMLTDYSGLSLFLNNAWVPVPLRANPMLLSGGVAGNYGAKDSGATIKVSMGDQATSETLTNTEDIDFSTNLKSYNDSIFDNGSEYTTQSIARTSDNFLGRTHLISQLKGGKNQQLLDESSSHFDLSGLTNAKFASDDPYRGIVLENYIPIGSDSHGNPISVIANYSSVDEFPEFKAVIKNASYDKAKNQLSFDLSQKKADWQSLAKALLANKDYVGNRPSWITDYLKQMANGNGDLNTTFTSLYFIHPQAFAPINNNFSVKIDVKATNSKSHATTVQHLIVDPVHAGNDDATKAGVKVQTMDTTGEAIGEVQTPQFYGKGDTYKAPAPAIKGYSLIATNPKDLIAKLGIPNVVEPTGAIDASNIGQLYNVAYEYTKEVPITYTVIDDTAHQTLESKKAFATGAVNQAFNTDENQGKLKAIEKSYPDKVYRLGQVERGNLPTPTDVKGYDIVIHLSHGTKKADKVDHTTVKQTIHYQGAGDKTPKDNVQPMTFEGKYSEVLDAVSNKVISKTSEVWTKEVKTKDIVSPNIDHYHVDKNEVKGSTYMHSDKDKRMVVTYSPVKTPAPKPSSDQPKPPHKASGVLPTTGSQTGDILMYGGAIVVLLALGGAVYYNKFKKEKN